MRSKTLYVPDGITLDLSKPGFGHPDGLEIIERHYRLDRRRAPEHGRSNPAYGRRRCGMFHPRAQVWRGLAAGQPATPRTPGGSNSDEPPRQTNGAVECRNTQTGRSADDVDPYRLGPWHDCIGCQRRYRPVHPSERCYDCRPQGNLSGTVDLTGL